MVFSWARISGENAQLVSRKDYHNRPTDKGFVSLKGPNMLTVVFGRNAGYRRYFLSVVESCDATATRHV